jgi:hypothetical protein
MHSQSRYNNALQNKKNTFPCIALNTEKKSNKTDSGEIRIIALLHNGSVCTVLGLEKNKNTMFETRVAKTLEILEKGIVSCQFPCDSSPFTHL